MRICNETLEQAVPHDLRVDERDAAALAAHRPAAGPYKPVLGAGLFAAEIGDDAFLFVPARLLENAHQVVA